MSTHDVDLAHRWAGEVAIMQDGRVVACGPPEQVLAEQPVMHAAGLRVPAAVAIEAALRAAGMDRPEALAYTLPRTSDV